MAEPQQDDPGSGATLRVGVAGVLLVVLSVIGLEVLYYHTERRARRALEAAASAERTELQRVQRQRLDGWRWVDRDRGVVAIPVERAMELVIEECGARVPEPGR